MKYTSKLKIDGRIRIVHHGAPTPGCGYRPSRGQWFWCATCKRPICWCKGSSESSDCDGCWAKKEQFAEFASREQAHHASGRGQP